MFVIHIWKATRQETRCGLSFKAIPALQKPNLVSVLVAMKIAGNNLKGILCKNCVRNVESLNPKIFDGKE
jgi:hypothetical protein